MESLRKEIQEIAQRNRKVSKELQTALIQKWAEFGELIKENIDIYSNRYLITIYTGDELYKQSTYDSDNKEIWAVWDKDENKILFKEMEYDGDGWERINSKHPKYIDSPEKIKKTGVMRYARSLIAAVNRYKEKLNEITDERVKMLEEIKELNIKEGS
ncbi:MAG: hypothetical protein LBF71_00605 [Campylobacteraceae bacterium]|jgi:hypothetical protein|nr:hypothetical protein [Campylobacteraceae bacterium]